MYTDTPCYMVPTDDMVPCYMVPTLPTDNSFVVASIQFLRNFNNLLGTDHFQW